MYSFINFHFCSILSQGKQKLIVVLEIYIIIDNMTSLTLALAFKQVIAEMPDTINTIAELNAYHKEAMTKAVALRDKAKVAEAVESMKKIRAEKRAELREKGLTRPFELELDYRDMCYAFQLKDNDFWCGDEGNWVKELYEDSWNDEDKVFKVEIIFLKTYKGKTIDPTEEIAYKMIHYYTLGHDGIPDNPKKKCKNIMRGEKDTFRRCSDYNDFIRRTMGCEMWQMMEEVYGYYEEPEEY